MNERTKKLKDSYEDLTYEEINKALEHVNYVLYDTTTGEVIQTGSMDLLAFERFEPYLEGMDKVIVPDGEEWMLRGEFVDSDGTQKPMFKVEDGGLVAKAAHVDKITEMRMPKDGTKKKPIEAQGADGKEIIGFETVQEPLKIEKVQSGTNPE